MRVACVSIANLSVQLAAIENPQLTGQPIVVGGSPFDKGFVFDASPEAVARGIKESMPLRQAYSLCPEAAFLPSNEAACQKALEKALDILDGFSPVVEREGLSCAYLDVTGVADERKLAGDIAHGIYSGTGLSACVAVSSGKFFSRVAAATSTPEAPVVLPAGSEKDFIAPFSIQFLPCSPETKERLHLLGIGHIGGLTNFSREALIARFSAEGKTMHDLAWGTDKSPLFPRKRPDFIAGAAELYHPATSYSEVLKACESLMGNLLDDVKPKGKLCRQVCLALSFESGPSQEKRLSLKEPTCSQAVIMNRINAWLEHVRFPSAMAKVEVKLFLASETGRRLSLWQGDLKSRDTLEKLAKELKARLGYQPLKRAKVVDSGAIFPERRTKLVEIGDQE